MTVEAPKLDVKPLDTSTSFRNQAYQAIKEAITAANLINALKGHPLSDLIDSIRVGHAYANAHTNDGVPPINTGPGDFPGGEIRGQIRTAGPQ